jgi:hypothetical protein
VTSIRIKLLLHMAVCEVISQSKAKK